MSGVLANAISKAWRQPALLVLLIASLFGAAVSVWAHIESLMGVDPGSRFKAFWIFQLILFLLVLPILRELVQRKTHVNVFRSPRWMRLCIYAMLAYYGVNFYFFVYWSSDNLNAAVTWRMFSAGWILIFSVAAVYYAVRLGEARK